VDQRKAEVVYWAAIFIVVFIVGAALIQLSDTSEKILKILSLGYALWLVFAVTVTIMLLNAVWEWRISHAASWKRQRWQSCVGCEAGSVV
jgi:Na+/glutamate symporter